MSKFIPFVLLGILLIGGGLFVLSQKKVNMPLIPADSEDTLLEPSADSDADSAAASALRIGGNSYLDSRGVYSFLYPNDYTLDDQDPQYVRIYKRGAQQRPQSEMSDGVIMVFESVDLQGRSLEALVDELIAQAQESGVSEITSDKQVINRNGYRGFTYKVSGLGEATYVVLQKEALSASAVSITYSVMDPQMHNYQSEVDSILSTVELLK